MGKRLQQKVAKHTHRYIRISGKFTSVWKCADPDCRHFVYASQDYIVEGRSSICWECGEKFTLDRDAMQDDMPKCPSCRFPDIELELTRTKKKPIIEDEIEIIEPENE